MTDQPSYDPAARRDTPLALALKSRLKRDGSMLVGEYVWVCLDDETFGYYRTRSAIGRDGDFVTAPEISQVFGELIGLWCAVVWQQMGCPTALQVIEIGPGRGTMIRDAVRAMRIVPGLLQAVDVVLIDVDPALIEVQRALLSDLPVNVEWLSSVDQLKPQLASIILANEYLDTRGVSQYVLREGKVYQRTVELDAAGNLSFGRRTVPVSLNIERLQCKHDNLSDGAILESQPNFQPTEVMRQFSTGPPLAALFIDYGSTGIPEFSIGDTLQAVRNHRYEHPLTSPGEADLTNQVNFTEFAQNALDQGLAVDGPVTQAEFLGRLGIIERASKLMSANPAKAAEIESGVARLMAPTGMGTRFKAIGIRSRQLPPLPGF